MKMKVLPILVLTFFFSMTTRYLNAQSSWNWKIYDKVYINNQLVFTLEFAKKTAGYNGHVNWRITNHTGQVFYDVSLNNRKYTLRDDAIVSRSSEQLDAKLQPGEICMMNVSDAVNSNENYGSWSDKNDNPVQNVIVEPPFIKLRETPDGPSLSWKLKVLNASSESVQNNAAIQQASTTSNQSMVSNPQIMEKYRQVPTGNIRPVITPNLTSSSTVNNSTGISISSQNRPNNNHSSYTKKRNTLEQISQVAKPLNEARLPVANRSSNNVTPRQETSYSSISNQNQNQSSRSTTYSNSNTGSSGLGSTATNMAAVRQIAQNTNPGTNLISKNLQRGAVAAGAVVATAVVADKIIKSVKANKEANHAAAVEDYKRRIRESENQKSQVLLEQVKALKYAASSGIPFLYAPINNQVRRVANSYNGTKVVKSLLNYKNNFAFETNSDGGKIINEYGETTYTLFPDEFNVGREKWSKTVPIIQNDFKRIAATGFVMEGITYLPHQPLKLISRKTYATQGLPNVIYDYNINILEKGKSKEEKVKVRFSNYNAFLSEPENNLLRQQLYIYKGNLGPKEENIKDQLPIPDFSLQASAELIKVQALPIFYTTHTDYSIELKMGFADSKRVVAERTVLNFIDDFPKLAAPQKRYDYAFEVSLLKDPNKLRDFFIVANYAYTAYASFGDETKYGKGVIIYHFEYDEQVGEYLMKRKEISSKKGDGANNIMAVFNSFITPEGYLSMEGVDEFNVHVARVYDPSKWNYETSRVPYFNQ